MLSLRQSARDGGGAAAGGCSFNWVHKDYLKTRLLAMDKVSFVGERKGV